VTVIRQSQILWLTPDERRTDNGARGRIDSRNAVASGGDVAGYARVDLSGRAAVDKIVRGQWNPSDEARRFVERMRSCGFDVSACTEQQGRGDAIKNTDDQEDGESPRHLAGALMFIHADC
jgi:hypothetical protein